MATKVPIYLKRGSRKGKKEKLRDVLSSDMISPPLGDFRHTIHVGSGGESDTFGDVSFLQGKFHLLPRAAVEAPPPPTPPFEFSRAATVSGGEAASPSPFEFSRAATVSGGEAASPSPFEFSRAATVSGGEAASPSPPLKNAVSLPALGAARAPTLPPPKPPRVRPDEAAASPPAANGEAEPFPSHAGSLLSLHVDLGPSILEDVLQVMERHRAERGGAARPEILT